MPYLYPVPKQDFGKRKICPTCKGRGYEEKERCPTCRGLGTIEKRFEDLIVTKEPDYEETT